MCNYKTLTYFIGILSNRQNKIVTPGKDLQQRAIYELKNGCSLKECVTRRLKYILAVFFCV